MKKREIPWDKMRQEYIFTSATIRSLAAKYGCSKRAVDRRSVAESWVELRHSELTDIGQEARARIREAAIQDKIRIYDATREAADRIVSAILRASQDTDGLFRHLVQFEHTGYDASFGASTSKKGTEDRVFKMINGRNLADVARALKDIVGIARALDGILDAGTQAKIDLDRERLDFEMRKCGQGDTDENETGIALMPAVDVSLLDDALNDPDQFATV